MPARDLYHDAVRNALIKDGWTITHDPYWMKVGGKDMFVDLGAERLLAAEKADQKIAVESKSFISTSEMDDLKNAIGTFVIYQTALAAKEPERRLFLAVPQSVIKEFFEEALGQLLLKNHLVRIIGYNSETEEITQWIL